MSFFVKPQPAGHSRTEIAEKIAVLYALLLVIMIIMQLFTFDDFSTLFISFNLPVGGVAIAALAPLIVVLELFALPFLLRMAVSPAFRWLSMVCGWFVAATWLSLSSATVSAYPSVETVGFLGTAAAVTPGLWALTVSLVFGIMAAWASWGMWPAGNPKK